MLKVKARRVGIETNGKLQEIFSCLKFLRKSIEISI